MKRIFSGIQPSGVLHLGNYLGAIKQFVELQNGSPMSGPPPGGSDSRMTDGEQNECVFCIVDLHAITVPQDPIELKKNILSVAAMYLACGIDPEKSIIFVQSQRPEVTELSWILNCFTNMGELERMTQFKDKSGENRARVSAGLFDYPVLMAADILLYQTTDVPVGEDQKQHVEITRNIAERINNKYAMPDGRQGQIFTVPNPQIKKETARIMGLDDPTKKMSKSASSALNYIALTDDAETIRDKVKRAVTDSGSEIKAGPDKPAISNLLTIFSGVSGKSISDLEQEFAPPASAEPEALRAGGKNYSEFKSALAEAIINFLAPIQKKYSELMAEPEKLREILQKGASDLAPIATKTLKDIKERIGLE